MVLLFISYFFGNIAAIGSPNIFVYGGFVMGSIYTITDLMDGKQTAWIGETLKNLFGIVWIIQTGDWFGIATYSQFAVNGILAYFIIATAVVAWFCLQIKKRPSLAKS
jgi:hypothetical protein